MPFRIRTKLITVIAVGFLLTFLSPYLLFNYMYRRYTEGIILERVREAEGTGWRGLRSFFKRDVLYGYVC